MTEYATPAARNSAPRLKSTAVSIFQIKIDVELNVRKTGVPKGIRTPVIAVRGQCPRPLDDGDLYTLRICFLGFVAFVHLAPVM
jgi:hypothetical protein